MSIGASCESVQGTRGMPNICCIDRTGLGSCVDAHAHADQSRSAQASNERWLGQRGEDSRLLGRLSLERDRQRLWAGRNGQCGGGRSEGR
eukprot:3444354-Rhodomonas_salina.4